MEHQACPFCGGEMRPGGLYLPLRPQPIRWVPADGAGYAPWDADAAITLSGTLEARADARPLAEQLFSSFPQADAWYCPACQKAVAFFQKAESFDDPFDDPFPNVPNGLFPTEAEVMASLREDKPGEKPEPAPEPRPRPGRDPWDKGGPFRRKKKPDWEF